MSAPDPTAGGPCPTCGLFREEPDEPIQPGDYYTVDPTSPTRCPSCGLVPSRGSEGAARVAQARHSTSPPAVADVADELERGPAPIRSAEPDPTAGERCTCGPFQPPHDINCPFSSYRQEGSR